MTFEILSSLKSHIIRWPRHLLMVGGICLLVACGGGGGGSGSSTTSSLVEPAPAIVNQSVGTIYPADPVFLKPTFNTGTAVITWSNLAGSVTGEIPVSASGVLIQDNPSSTRKYTLTVTYQDPTKAYQSFLQKSSDVLTVTVTDLPTAPVYLDKSTNTLTQTTGRSDHASVTLPDGRVLVSGGTDGTTVLKTSEVFDPSTEKWTTVAPMTSARRGHTMTVLSNNKVLVTGGFDGKAALATAEVYDPSSNIWTATLKPMALTRRFHTATELPDGNVLIAGGVVGPLITDDPRTTEVYMLSGSNAGGFDKHVYSAGSTGLALREARQGHTATLVSGDRVLFLGNSSNNSGEAKLLDYDSTTPGNSTWTTINLSASSAYTNCKRYNHTATVLNVAKTEIFIIGGGTCPKTTALLTLAAKSGTPSASTTTGHTWVEMGAMTVNRSYHTAQLLQDGNVLVMGGYDSQVSLNSIDKFTLNSTTQSWEPTRDTKLMNVARAMHTSSMLKNGSGSIVILGTYFQSSGVISNVVDIWRP
jgi:hypothetical protein